MNEKGFTLVELLAVIAILAVLVIFIAPNIAKILDKQEDNVNDMSISNLGDAAITYAMDNIFLKQCANGYEPTTINSVSVSGCSTKIKVSKLIEDGYFTDEKNACDKNREVLVYRYRFYTLKNNEVENDVDEFRYFIEPGTCNVK